MTARPWCSAASSSTTQREDDTKVPYLGDIPVLGNLFKNTSIPGQQG